MKMINIILFVYILLLFIDPACNVMVFAQDTKSKSQNLQISKPVLNNHSFILTSLSDGPFVNTFFRLTGGVGSSSNYDVPLVIGDKEIVGLFGQLTYVSLAVKYQQNIRDWLSFSVSAEMKGRIGSEEVSVISEGIDVGSNFGIGWVFKVHESKKLMLSASLNMKSISVTYFDLREFVEKTIENGEITRDNKLVKTSNITAGQVGFSSAFAFNRTFGSLGKLNVGYGESISGKNRGYFDVVVSFDADLFPMYSIPIGFDVGYGWNNYSQTDLGVTNPQSIVFGINYTGKQDLDLGLESAAQFFKITKLNQNIDLEVLLIKMILAYHF